MGIIVLTDEIKKDLNRIRPYIKFEKRKGRVGGYSDIVKFLIRFYKRNRKMRFCTACGTGFQVFGRTKYCLECRKKTNYGDWIKKTDNKLNGEVGDPVIFEEAEK